jgi:hypothetical protein
VREASYAFDHMNKLLGGSVFLGFVRLRQRPRIRISLAGPSQRPVTGAAATRGDWVCLPKEERSEWALRQSTEPWASSARSAHSLSDQTKTYEKEQIQTVKR